MKKRIILLFTIITTLSSCAFIKSILYTVHINPAPTLSQQAPVLERLPLVIGLYQNQIFRQYSTTQDWMDNDFVFELGKPSARLVEDTLRGMFDGVVTVEDVGHAPKEVVAVLEPEIERFTWNAPGPDNVLTHQRIEIVYRFTLFDGEKHPIAVLRVRGIGYDSSRWFFTTIRKATEIAMKDAMAQFMINFREYPEIKLWLVGKGITDSNGVDK